jgi:hypothetical protein
MHSFILHFASRPEYDFAAIKARSEQVLDEKLNSSGSDKSQQMFLLFHKSHPVELKDGVICPQTALLCSDPDTLGAPAEEIFQQSWSCPEARELLAPSRHTLMVCEMMSQALPAVERLRLLHGVLQAVLEQTRPLAIVCHHSQQVIRTQDYLDSVGDDPVVRPGTLNVRFFRISDSGGDMLMDTRGLDELGLPDLQCHYRGLAPNDISRVLYNTAIYLIENGPVIESGHTVQGTEPGSRWTCQLEDALIAPERTVLDLNPGPPHAAGNREG